RGRGARGGGAGAGGARRGGHSARHVSHANPPQPVLFFTSRGMVYQLKVYMLPLGTPQARGKPLVNLLPQLPQGDSIATIMPLPQDEAQWATLNAMFATSSGSVRRNALSDFVNIKANGKIAMKLEAAERRAVVVTCTEDQDVLLSSAGGKAIRFPVGEVREFTSRTSTGVRGIKLAEGDAVISLSMLRHGTATVEERVAYLRMAAQRRRGEGEASEESLGEPVEEVTI